MTDEREPAATEPGPPEAAPPAAPRSLARPVLAGAALVGLGLLAVLTLLPPFLSRPSEPTPPPTPAGVPDAQQIQATLFYVSEDGSELVPIVREVPYGATTAEQALRLVEAQLRAPADGATSAIPKGTSVRAVFLGTRGDAYVDLSGEAAAGPGGALTEALAVFAIVNAVTSNLPDVSAVQILVNGKEVDSLAGHLDLRQPIGRASDWIRKGQ